VVICCSVSGSSRWGCYPSCCLGSQSHVQSISDSELLAVSRTAAGLCVAMHACAHCSAVSELRGLCSDDTCMTPARLLCNCFGLSVLWIQNILASMLVIPACIWG
jgi:hypothetical protein